MPQISSEKLDFMNMAEKYDLHTHLFTTWEPGRFSLERAPRDLGYLLDCIGRAGMDGIVLANFADSRYEQFTRMAREMGNNRWRIRDYLDNACIFENQQGKKIRVIKGEEVATDKGHILVLGLPSDKHIGQGKTLDEAIKIAKEDYGAVVGADHVLNIYGIGKEELVKHAPKLDFFERSNANFPEISLGEVTYIFLETRLHGIATSDSHNRIDIGNGHIESEDPIDFSSADNLKGSLASMLHNSRFRAVAKKRNPRISTLGHGCLVFYDTFRRKHGLL